MNCISLLGNFGDIVDFNISLNNVFDVICVTETWLNASTADLVNMQGSTFVGKNRISRKGGGVGIYVKDQIKFKLRTDIDSDNENCEIIAIEILNDQAKNIIIISLYRPPGTDMNLFIDTINRISFNY